MDLPNNPNLDLIDQYHCLPMGVKVGIRAGDEGEIANFQLAKYIFNDPLEIVKINRFLTTSPMCGSRVPVKTIEAAEGSK